MTAAALAAALALAGCKAADATLETQMEQRIWQPLGAEADGFWLADGPPGKGRALNGMGFNHCPLVSGLDPGLSKRAPGHLIARQRRSVERASGAAIRPPCSPLRSADRGFPRAAGSV